MSLTRMTSFVVCFAIGVACIGGGIGLAVASTAGFYSHATGLTLGVSQGAAFGAILGAFLVMVKLWHERRKDAVASNASSCLWTLAYLLGVGITVVGVVAIAGALMIAYVRSTPLQLAKNVTGEMYYALHEDPRFELVDVDYNERGLYISGSVTNAKDFVALVEAVESEEPPIGVVFNVDVVK